MCFVACWLGLVGLGIADEPTNPRAEIKATVRLAPGPYFVGQAVDLAVTWVNHAPGETTPVVEPPRTARADLFAIGLDHDGPARGDPTVVARFLLVPRQVGLLTLPPFRVRRDDQPGVTRSTAVTVEPVPLAGRSAAFLGGVGPGRAVSAVEPGTVRVGQPVELRITLTGPAAFGSQQAPDLTAWATLPAAFEVRALANQLEPSDPPTRTFRYRLRPRRAGRTVLPPIALAAFDPASQRFLTQYTSSLALVVEPPPRFDPARVDFGPTLEPAARTTTRPDRLAILLGVAVGWLGLCSWIIRRFDPRRRANDRPDWGREAAELARWASREWRGLDAAEEVVERLARGIARSTGRDLAVLTPLDAEAGVLAITGDSVVARQSQRLVTECDRLRFDPDADATVGDLEELVAEAVAVFQAIGSQTRKPPSDLRANRGSGSPDGA